MDVQTVKCNICGHAYKFYAYMAGDQSACPSCIAQAESNMKITITTTGTVIISNTTCPTCGRSK